MTFVMKHYPWHVFFSVCFRYALIGGDLTAQSTGSRGTTRELEVELTVEFKFQRRSCKLSSFSCPAARAPRRACSQATRGKVNTTELGYTYMLPGALTAKYCYGFSSFTFYKSQISGTAEPRDGLYGFFVLLQNTLPTEFFSTN